MLTHETKKQTGSHGYPQQQLSADEKNLLKGHLEIMQMDCTEPHPLRARLAGLIVKNSHNEVPMLMQLRTLAVSALFIKEKTMVQQPLYNEWDNHVENLMQLHEMLYELLMTGVVSE